MKQHCLDEHWSRKWPCVPLWTGLVLAAALTMSCGYTEESFPYAHLFKAGWGGSNATPVERYRHAIEQAQEKGSVPLRVCFDEPFPLTTDLSAEDEQRYIEAVSQAQDKIVSSIRKGRVGIVKKFIYTACVSFSLDEPALDELVSIADELGVRSVSENLTVAPALAESVPLIGGDLVWGLGHAGAGQTIAILDTGVDENRDFLTEKMVSRSVR